MAVSRSTFEVRTSRRRTRAIALALSSLGILSASAFAGPVIAEDFEGTVPADAMTAYATGRAAGKGEVAAASGTIDSYMGQPGHSASLVASFAAGDAEGVAGLKFDLKAAPHGITDLSRLTLGADVRVVVARPVRIRIASIGTAGKPTGGLSGIVYPPVGHAWYRHCVDLSTLTPDGGGTFDPTALRLEVRFELASAGGDEASTASMRVDNVSLSAPTFYVGERGSDQADGKTEATAFATVQKGIDAAKPGDVVMLLDGTYRNTSSAGIARIAKAGTPAAWITIRAAPGHAPKLVNDGWEVVKLVPGAAYIELRDLDIGGNRANVNLDDARADGAMKEKDGKKYGGDPKFNGNGISAEGRDAKDDASRPHHLRFINNRVHDNCGGGISAIACDYVTTVGNESRSNCHAMRYGGSGISYLNLSNFDDSQGHRAFILNNVVKDNRCYVPWAAVGHMSDGNSIIVDVNRHEKMGGDYNGRTLIANNLCIGGGGGGVTVTSSAHVDIINNTLYHNVQTDELAKSKYPWGDVFMSGPLPNCEDVRAFNNVVWSGPGRSVVVAGRAEDYRMMNNVYFGDPGAPIKRGDTADVGNVVADPRLARPSKTGTVEDFRPLPDSPAIGIGRRDLPGVPLTDLTGRPRPTTGPVTAGALLPASTNAAR